jgi:hypothetical protein
MQPTSRHRSSFDSLIKLLDNFNEHFLPYLSVFVIPVIRNIQNSQSIYGDTKQVTLILAQLLSLLPLNLSQLNASAPQEESKSSTDLEAQARAGYRFL